MNDQSFHNLYLFYYVVIQDCPGNLCRFMGHFPSPFLYFQNVLFYEALHLFVDISPLLSVVTLHVPIATLITLMSTLIYVYKNHIRTPQIKIRLCSHFLSICLARTLRNGLCHIYLGSSVTFLTGHVSHVSDWIHSPFCYV